MTPPNDSADRVQLTVRLRPDLHARLNAAVSGDPDLSANGALNTALEEWLDRREREGGRPTAPESGLPLVDVVSASGADHLTLVVDGHPVPYIKVHKVDRPGSGDAFGKATLTLDDRFATQEMRWDEFWRWGWFLANAMAVAAGYTSHGPNSYRANRHGPSEPVADLRAWADRGWTVHEASGSGGKGYELALTFNLPHMDVGDLRCYDLRSQIIALLVAAGARDVSSRLIAVGPMQAEPSLL